MKQAPNEAAFKSKIFPWGGGAEDVRRDERRGVLKIREPWETRASTEFDVIFWREPGDRVSGFAEHIILESPDEDVAPRSLQVEGGNQKRNKSSGRKQGPGCSRTDDDRKQFNREL